MTDSTCEILRPMAFARRGNLIAIASGKGGVGKTWLAVSLAHAMARAGRRTLLFDGDLGLANVDIQLGLMPQDDVGGVLAGRLTLPQASTPFAENLDIIAGRSGSGRLGSAPVSRLQHLCQELVGMSRDYDLVLLDLGGGVEQTVRQFAQTVDTCLVVVTDEPTSLTDAYAFIKVAHADRPDADLRVVVNIAASRGDGERTYATLLKACQGFLKISPPLLGVIRRDVRVSDSIRQQTSIMTRSPRSAAACDINAVALRLLAETPGRKRLVGREQT
ncbi:MAG: AAA family ATPase [Rhodospirillales bacterium]|nr:AAA family ATPase [Rhodospirillales bacterium]